MRFFPAKKSDSGRMMKSARNMVSGIAFRLLTLLTAFVVRTVFIRCLDNAYLSVNGLYTSILSMLSLAELGFGTAMVYSMYKPLADKDYDKLSQLMRLYKTVYRIIGLVILVLGLAVIPFMDFIIKNKPDLPNLTFYYILFLCDCVASYLFFSYRNSVLQADQRASVISNYGSVFNLVKSALQIVFLICFRSFTVYLLIQIGCTVLQNIALAIKVKKDYPIFSIEKHSALPKKEKSKIFKDVRALMIQKVSFKVLNTSDSLIISAFVGVNWVGLLSNYLLIVDAVVAAISQLFGAITASLGNYFAKENREAGYGLFLKIDLVYFWIFGFSSMAFLTLLNPFVTIWLGEKYLLTLFAVIALVLRFFVEGYMNMMSTFRSTMGLFTQGKYFPLIVAGINIALSIGFSYPFGVAGVLLATPLSRCIINVWYMPLVIFRDGFGKPVRQYYFKCIRRVIMLSAMGFLMLELSNLICRNGVSIGKFIALVFLVIIIPNAVLVLVYRNTTEFKYFWTLLQDKVFRKLKSKN